MGQPHLQPSGSGAPPPGLFARLALALRQLFGGGSASDEADAGEPERSSQRRALDDAPTREAEAGDEGPNEAELALAPESPPPAETSAERTDAPDPAALAAELGAWPAGAAPVLDPEVLGALADQAFELLRARRRMPAFPGLAMQILDLVRAREPDVSAMVRLISQDPSLAAQVVRMANSAHYSRGVEITGIREAVTRLGLEEVARVAASAATMALFRGELGEKRPEFEALQRRLWIHAMTSAFAGGWLAMQVRADTQRAFLGGMLHDIGKTMALGAVAELSAKGKLGALDVLPFLEPLVDAMHVELGSRMAESWKLPPYLVKACTLHHAPELPDHADHRELHVVRVVSSLADLRLNPGWAPERLDELRQSAAVLGIDRFRLRATSTEVRDFAVKAGTLLRSVRR